MTVSAAVLSADEDQRYFGAGLADQGIQAIWLSVENSADATLYYLPVTTDPSYFSPSEAAQLLREWWSDKANTATDSILAQDAMPDVIPPRQTAAGFVLTHREGGLKFINAGFVGGGQQFDFRFVLPLGGRTYAVQKVDFNGLYSPGTIEALDLAELRARWSSCLAARPTRRAKHWAIRSISLSSAAAQKRFFHLSCGDGGWTNP